MLCILLDKGGIIYYELLPRNIYYHNSIERRPGKHYHKSTCSCVPLEGYSTSALSCWSSCSIRFPSSSLTCSEKLVDFNLKHLKQREKNQMTTWLGRWNPEILSFLTLYKLFLEFSFYFVFRCHPNNLK